jgi:Coenzyme PQQ synthesis protein D (PqqD)
MYTFPTTVLKSTVDDEMVLMDTAKGEYYGLNKTGTILLKTLLETQSAAAAIAKAVELFDAPEDIIAADLGQLVEDLLKKKLLVEAQPGG